MPANAAFFGSTATVPGWWDQYSPESRRAIEDSLGSQDIFDLDDLKNVDELVAVLSGEIAGAAWFEDGDPDGVFLAEVADEAKALALFVKLMREDSPRAAVSKRTVNGVEVTLVGDNAAAVSKGVAYAGSLTGVTTVLTAKSGSLKGSAALAHSTSALGAPLGSFLFIDINAVIAGSGADSGFGFFAPPDALDAFILNIVNNGGFARFGAAVTVKE